MENKQTEYKISKMPYILIAEDDPYYSKIYRHKFTKDGFNVEVAENGEKALEIVKRKKPDIILLDLIMPVKDGFQVLRELKEDDSLKNIKVVAVSNLGEKDDIERINKLGADGYIIKNSISIYELVEKIKKYL